MTVGEMIARYCNEHGISYRRFAEASNLSSGYISMLVAGRNPKTGKPPIPTIKTIQSIADAMGISVPEVLRETEKDTPSYYHVVSDDESSKYKNLAKAIVDQLKESSFDESTGPVLTIEETRLIEAYRAADERARNDALKLLLAYPATQEKSRA